MYINNFSYMSLNGIYSKRTFEKGQIPLRALQAQKLHVYGSGTFGAFGTK